MKANEAKQKAMETRKKVQDSSEKKKDVKHENDVVNLIQHFNKKIDDAVGQGKLSTDPQKFKLDQFSNDVIRDVSDYFTSNDFQFSMDKHNAFQELKITISWS